MRLPTPADLCWNVKCSPDQEWIERTLRIAVENVWPQALETAHSRNGHGSHVVEIVESAIEHAVCRLKTGDPLGSEQVTQLLQRLVLQEVRRRRRANGRMVFVGSSDELPPTPVRNPQIQIDCALDLEIILQGETPDVRLALLLRYSRFRWSEIAAALGTTEAAVRLRCKRAIERIREKQEGEQHES